MEMRARSYAFLAFFCGKFLTQQAGKLLYRICFKAGDGFYDGRASLRVDKRRGKPVKFGGCLFPGQRASIKAFVVALLDAECTPVAQGNLDAAGHLGGEAPAEGFLRVNADFTQQILDILPPDAFRRVLRGRDFAVEQGCRHHVRQAVVSLFFGIYLVLTAFLAAADDIIGDIKDGNIDLLDIFRLEMLAGAQFQHAFQRRLRMELGIVLFDAGARDGLKIFLPPVDLEVSGDGVHETLVASNTSSGPVMPRMARKAALVAAEAVLG